MNPISFELFAPNNESIALVGSWNNWQSLPMTRGEDGTWRISVPLEDGDYEYQFEVLSVSPALKGKRLRVGDPTSVRLTHGECTPLLIRGGHNVRTDYTWQNADVPLPQNHELIIYEIHAKDFVGLPVTEQASSTVFTRMIEKLPYLNELGINAIQLMPVNDFPNGYNWGYSQNSLYAVEDTYGTPEDLCRLVDACHGLGIRVIHDGVYNHTDANAILTKIDYNTWFYREEDNRDEPALQYGPKFNYMYFDKKHNLWPARAHVMGAIQCWTDLFHFDGIRFDSTRALRYYGLLQWFYNVTHQRDSNKPFLTIAEHLPEDSGIAGPDGPMDASWRMNLWNQLVATVSGKPNADYQPYSPKAMIRVLDYRCEGYVAASHIVTYLDNHDHDRILWQISHGGIFDEEASWRRAKLGATILLTAPGIPMLRMGEEFGVCEPKQEPTVPAPLDWSLLEQKSNHDLWHHYQRLIRLRKENPALHGDSFEVIAQQEERGILAFKRVSTDEDKSPNSVFVVVNLCDEAAPYVRFHAPSLEDGIWCDFITGQELEICDGQFDGYLGASEARVYIRASTH